MHVDLLVPVKPLAWAKTRLRGAADGGAGAPQAHSRLVLALVRDTLTAATGAARVRQVVAICSDEVVCAALADDGVQTIPDEPAAGLNPALRYGEAVLRAAGLTAAMGVLQADLPALRPQELDRAIHAALATGDRAFCADRTGTGTTLLLTPPGQLLGPCFGPGSAAAHRATGARELIGGWPGLRCDVDTAADLAAARGLGLGRFTSAALDSR
ncbi:MAG: 2-phospho-L-lactate guanylyltransferase [Pseudonocardiales bacterium]|nr:2-phospho-L-lactate guanylyltransferase [Actinomycetota bacterium]PZS22376.1 MAG: 2-phospho-L-lactate guanylyltransferase [Pseudonocardiales bacterium]